MSVRVAAALRSKLEAAAGHRYGYCQTSQLVTGTPLEVEHLVPKSRGGRTVEENLWLACRLCNVHKSDRETVPDPLSGASTPMYNPRIHNWFEHFCWTADGVFIEGLTPIGRAAVWALKLNRPSLIVARRTWVSHGLHPPQRG